MKTKILIVNANYYREISSGLLAAAQLTFDMRSTSKVKYSIINVPGIFEIPVVISKHIKKYDGFVALGCIIKGETPHFDYICKSTFHAIMSLSIEHKKPIGNGIITCLNINQASTRSSNNVHKKNRGTEAARAVLSVLGILKHESR